MPAHIPIRIRILKHVKHNTGPNGDCWEWTASRETKMGYGYIQVMVNGKKKKISAHRASYTEFIGPIPDGMCVLHSCDNPPCVNPQHFFLGTKGDNNRDRHAKGRTATGDQIRHFNRRRGSTNNKAKLTEDIIPEIRKHIAEGRSMRSLGIQYGVSAQSITAIRDGLTWTHVPIPDQSN